MIRHNFIWYIWKANQLELSSLFLLLFTDQMSWIAARGSSNMLMSRVSFWSNLATQNRFWFWEHYIIFMKTLQRKDCVIKPKACVLLCIDPKNFITILSFQGVTHLISSWAYRFWCKSFTTLCLFTWLTHSLTLSWRIRILKKLTLGSSFGTTNLPIFLKWKHCWLFYFQNLSNWRDDLAVVCGWLKLAASYMPNILCLND